MSFDRFTQVCNADFSEIPHKFITISLCGVNGHLAFGVM